MLKMCLIEYFLVSALVNNSVSRETFASRPPRNICVYGASIRALDGISDNCNRWWTRGR